MPIDKRKGVGLGGKHPLSQKNEEDEELSDDFSGKLPEHSEFKENSTSRSSRGIIIINNLFI